MSANSQSQAQLSAIRAFALRQAAAARSPSPDQGAAPAAYAVAASALAPVAPLISVPRRALDRCKAAHANVAIDPENYMARYEELLRSVTFSPVKAQPRTPAKYKTTANVIREVIASLQPLMLECNALIMGSAVMYVVDPRENNKPNDIDIWFPKSSDMHEASQNLPTGWHLGSLYNIDKDNRGHMSPHVTRIMNAHNPDYEFDLQLIQVSQEDLPAIAEEFDFSVSRGIYSPVIHIDGRPIGFRATRKEVIADIHARRATYLCHDWDIVMTNGQLHLNKKAIARIKKYLAKGITFTVARNSPLSDQQVRRDIAVSDEPVKKSGFYDADPEFVFKYPMIALNSTVRRGLSSLYAGGNREAITTQIAGLISELRQAMVDFEKFAQSPQNPLREVMPLTMGQYIASTAAERKAKLEMIARSSIAIVRGDFE